MAVMEELLSTVDAVFEEKQEIKATAAELDLAELKVRKLLITFGSLFCSYNFNLKFDF